MTRMCLAWWRVVLTSQAGKGQRFPPSCQRPPVNTVEFVSSPGIVFPFIFATENMSYSEDLRSLFTGAKVQRRAPREPQTEYPEGESEGETMQECLRILPLSSPGEKRPSELFYVELWKWKRERSKHKTEDPSFTYLSRVTESRGRTPTFPVCLRIIPINSVLCALILGNSQMTFSHLGSDSKSQKHG